RMRRRRVDVEVVLLDVLAVVALAVGEPEQPLLQDGVAPVPESEREAQALPVVRDPAEAVLSPAVGPRPRLVVAEVIPGVAVLAVVLAHRAPLPLAQVRPPLLPRDPQFPDVVQALLLGRLGQTRTRAGPGYGLRSPALVIHLAILFSSYGRHRTLDYLLRLPRDHQLLVRRNHPRRHPAARSADARPAFLVCRAVELHPQPCGIAADPFTNGRAVLSDTGCEHQGVQAAERRRKRAHLAPDAIHVEVDGELRPGIVGGEELPHVAGDPGDAEQARLVVDQLLDGARIHPALVHQVEQHARIEGAAARAHRQAVDGGEARPSRHAAG